MKKAHVMPDNRLRAYLSHAYAYYGMRVVEHELDKIVRELLGVGRDKYVAFFSFAGISATECNLAASSIAFSIGESEKAVNWSVTPLAQLVDRLVKLGVLRRIEFREDVKYYFTVDILVFYCPNYDQHPEPSRAMLCETCTNCINNVETRELKVRDPKTGQIRKTKKEVVRVVYKPCHCPKLDVALFEVKTSISEPYRPDKEELKKLIEYAKTGLQTYYVKVQIKSLDGKVILDVYRVNSSKISDVLTVSM